MHLAQSVGELGGLKGRLGCFFLVEGASRSECWRVRVVKEKVFFLVEGASHSECVRDYGGL